MNVLILEDDPQHAFIIYKTLKENYEGISCFPHVDYEHKDSREMTDLIKHCQDFRDRQNDAKEVESLKRYIEEEVMGEGVKPDLLIVDINFDEKDEQDVTGAMVRKRILFDLYPKTLAILCTAYRTTEEFSSYIIGENMLISKSERGLQDFEGFFGEEFEKILVEKEFEVERRHPAINDPGSWWRLKTFLRRNTRKLFNGRLPYYAGITTRLLGYCMLLCCACFIFVFFFAAYNIFFSSDAENQLRDLVGKLLQGVELLFMGILPLIIMTSFYMYFKNIIGVDFDPLTTGSHSAAYAERKKKEAHYYLNLSKILFISTLLSLLATKFLEAVTENLKTQKDERFEVHLAHIVAIFVFFLLLLLFYRLIEKNLSEISKEMDGETMREEHGK